LISPISDILQIVSAWSKDSDLAWRPEKQPDNFASWEIEIAAQAGLVINLTKNKLLWAKTPTKPCLLLH